MAVCHSLPSSRAGQVGDSLSPKVEWKPVQWGMVLIELMSESSLVKSSGSTESCKSFLECVTNGLGPPRRFMRSWLFPSFDWNPLRLSSVLSHSSPGPLISKECWEQDGWFNLKAPWGQRYPVWLSMHMEVFVDLSLPPWEEKHLEHSPDGHAAWMCKQILLWLHWPQSGPRKISQIRGDASCPICFLFWSWTYLRSAAC